MGLSLLACCASVAAVVACVLFVILRFGFHMTFTKSGVALVVPSYDMEGEPVRVLRVGGGNQSATHLDEDWAVPCGNYIKSFDLMFDAGVPIRSVLMLGGGGYSYPKHLLTTRDDVSMDVVEYDPAITKLAWRYFYLKELVEFLSAWPPERLGLVTADGREYLRNTSKLYDAVINDTFRGNVASTDLASLDAAREYKRHLASNGIYLTNVIAAFEGDGSQSLRDVVVTLGCEFANIVVVPCWKSPVTAVDNKLVIATDADFRWPQAYRGDLTHGGHVLRD